MRILSFNNLDILYKARMVILFSFLFFSIFDPADRIFGAKIELFVLYGILLITLRFHHITFNIELLTIIILFILIPGSSIIYFYMSGGGYPYNGFLMLNGYLFCSIAFLFYNERFLILDLYCKILTLLAITIIIIAIAINLFPVSFPIIYSYGYQYGFLSIDSREYSDSLVLTQIYYVTSPLLIISLGYFFTKALSTNIQKNKFLFLVLALISFIGLFLAGSRNNLILAFLTPAAIYFFFSKDKIKVFVFYLLLFSGAVYFFLYDILLAFFDSNEYANKIKIGLLQTYLRVFSDPVSFLFGSGIGNYEYWDSKSGYSATSEFSFIEIIRYFGLLGSLPILVMIVLPAYNLLVSNNKIANGLAISFLSYIVLSFTNPNFFNSMGMTIYAIVLAFSYKIINKKPLNL